jgi:hypothetical protein
MISRLSPDQNCSFALRVWKLLNVCHSFVFYIHKLDPQHTHRVPHNHEVTKVNQPIMACLVWRGVIYFHTKFTSDVLDLGALPTLTRRSEFSRGIASDAGFACGESCEKCQFPKINEKKTHRP